MARLKRVFEMFDSDADGLITAVEVMHGIHMLLDIEVPTSNVENTMKDYDSKKKGTINFDQFVQMMPKRF